MQNRPECIHIAINAADAMARFDELGLRHTFRTPPTPDEVTEMLGRQVGRLFTLTGQAEEPYDFVALKIEGVAGEVVSVLNRFDPPFAADYIVASEPPPSLSVHGDYLFDLMITGDVHS